MTHITVSHNGDELLRHLHQFMESCAEEIRQEVISNHQHAAAMRTRRTGRGVGSPVMVPVTSSCLKVAGYDGVSATLYLQFRKGWKTYAFYHVPAEVYGALMAAPSKGQYYHAHIEGRYRFP